MLIAEIFINIPVKRVAKPYSYLVPEEIAYLGCGWRVLVPFQQRIVEGFVYLCRPPRDGEDITGLKSVVEALDEEAWFTTRMMEAARKLSNYYLATMAEMLRLFVPGKSSCTIKKIYKLTELVDNTVVNINTAGQAVLSYLAGNPECTEEQLKKALPCQANIIKRVLHDLAEHGYVEGKYVARKRAVAKLERYAELRAEVTTELLNAYKGKRAQQRVLVLLQEKGGTAALRELKLLGVHTAPLKALSDAGIVVLVERRSLRDSYKSAPALSQGDDLTAAQRSALETMRPYLEQQQIKKGFLLHGVTGSGKTRVYIEAVAMTRRTGRQAVVLVPEIALTGQLVQAFKNYFPQDIIVIHSRLTLSERNDAMLRLRTGEAGIVIGARSALFAPLTNIGLVVIDEEQDMSYKQDELPRYHARTVAELLCEVHEAVLLLGSATPSMETYYRASMGELTLLSLPERIGGRHLPQVFCVDMRQELQRGHRGVISRALHELINETCQKKEQIILMLNRRGYSTFVMCRSCGKVITCPECKLSMVYHWDKRLVCHHCDIQAPVPEVCPSCGSRYIKFFGSGTEKLEEELRETHRTARIIRMDRDTTGSKFAHSEIIKEFREKKYDILLGTQMVAKGHDIASVTAVGIISADSSLNMPDFRAGERCFMLITQTAGRAGRGETPGRVIVQSYSPEHYAVECALRQDYQSFYRSELEMRRILNFPPFCRLVKLVIQHKELVQAQRTGREIKEALTKWFGVTVEQQASGPVAAVPAEVRGLHRQCLLIKTRQLDALRDFLRQEKINLLAGVSIDIDPVMTN